MMKEKQYNLVNNTLGWILFVIATATYLMSMESTTSFWDCGEFIVSAYKLEIGHPPGNPIFMLVANLFTQLASDPTMKAIMVNFMSVICSAFTILFLFWTITHLSRKIICQGKNQTMGLSQFVTIMACGAVGSLAYTFSDTFWFSAVEGEVYAFSSLLTALVFWLILKWEDVAEEPHANRWLILIAYVMGLSIAVHLLNLLCIPAIVLVYYFKKCPNPNWKGATGALLLSFGIIVVILYGLIQGIVKVAGWFELLFVNTLHFPYNYGVGFYLVLVFGVLCWGIYETMQEKYNATRSKIAFVLAITLLGVPFFGNGIIWGILLTTVLIIFLFFYKRINPGSLNSVLIGLFVIVVGYSSYALIMIRSASNPPMDQNSPEDIFTLRDYLTREQYGETPLLYGQTYASEPKRKIEGDKVTYVTKDNGPIWKRIPKRDSSERDRYFIASRKEKTVLAEELDMLFPRMYSRDPQHIQAYKQWANVKGKPIKIPDYSDGSKKLVMKPTFAENLRFFFSYQVNFMYWRYFMWNFSGRQNETQGHGEVSNGNWITGFKFIDKYLAGPQDDLPDFIALNKGHNRYYMMPLLLGILGILFQLNAGKKGSQGFWITFLLFFMTGLAIVVYLNQPPYQPRERDYAYAGSFYAFCIWIGIGTVWIIDVLQKHLKMPPMIATVVGTVICLFVPFQMASENWDDHNRANRNIARDLGFNYLATCEPNAVIFTNGDNDTFPLWYAQEVEGFRTDVRVCNLSYLQTDWYIDQMKRQAYESEPLPISWKKHEYIYGTHEAAHIIPLTKQPWSVGRALDRVRSEDLRTKQIPGYDGELDNIPTNTLYIPIDSAKVVETGIVKPENANNIPEEIIIYLGERINSQGEVIEQAKPYLNKQEMMVLNMLYNNKDWSRPFYFAVSVGSEFYLRMENYFRQDGIAYRIVPFETVGEQRIDADVLYDNLINKYRWGNLDHPDLFIDETSGRLIRSFRALFGILGQRLIQEGKNEKAKEAMDYSLKVIPEYNVPYDYYSTDNIAMTYYMLGELDKAKGIYDKMITTSLKNLNWYNRLNNNEYLSVFSEIRREMLCVQEILSFYKETDNEVYEQYFKEFAEYFSRYSSYMQMIQSQSGQNR